MPSSDLARAAASTAASLAAVFALAAVVPRNCAHAQAAAEPVVAMFRGGATHAGVYRTAGVPAFGGLQWRVQTGGPVRSSPTVAGGVLYVGSGDGFVYAIDAVSGAVKWRREMGGAVASTPAVAGGLVYVGAAGGSYRALRAADGTVAWTFKAGAEVPLAWGLESGQVYGSSPAISGSTVLFGAEDGNLYAVDARTGRERWRFAAGARIYDSPAVAGGAVFVGSQRGVVYAVDLASGRERWRYAVAGASDSSSRFGFDRTTLQSSPTVAGDAVYIGARDGVLYALDRATGELRWRNDHKMSWVNSTPAVDGGMVYAGSSDARFVQGVDAATGQERWRSPATGIVWASPAVDDARVYVGDGAGVMFAFDKATGKEAWRYRVGGALFSSPALHEGRLYFGSDDGGVYAVNAARGEPLRRAVFWDTAYAEVATIPNHRAVRGYLADRGYEVLDAPALQRFMAERVRDRAPSSVVFAIDYAPRLVAPVAADTVLLRRYLNAGGTVVWVGLPPMLWQIKDTAGRSLAGLDRSATAAVLGVRHPRANFDLLGVTRVTTAGKRLGLPDWWLDSWAASPSDVTTVLAYDEQGQAAAWTKDYGGPPGSGFVRLFAGTGAPGRPASMWILQTAAELRPSAAAAGGGQP
ncbi:MAG TPA: PQQ-binding-like beta-propeller repeat protein [Gemmatimonadaceae bacterium]|nr:PQQ-binding-like beta-propeller repeat protein [Gemmatimonadaceae bacterium]